MAEYIEREALIKRLNSLSADVVFQGCDITMIHGKDTCNPREWTRGYQEGVMLAINKIESQDAADVASVVQCKDCKHMIRKLGACYCYAWGHFNGAGEDGFCNYGEQKERERE